MATEGLFIIGSSRSGTTLLHKILQQLPTIAIYSAEPMLIYQCRIKYGELGSEISKNRFLNDWYNSRQFIRSGVSRSEFNKLLNNKNVTYTSLLKGFMELIANKQKCTHWIDSTPANSFAVDDIIKGFPDAKIIHIIRDGRAVSLSLAKLNWAGVRSSNINHKLCNASLKWQSSISSIKKRTNLNGTNILEVKYEDLVTQPIFCLTKVLTFLDYGYHINDINLGDISAMGNAKNVKHLSNNSAFGDLGSGISTVAAYRWKNSLDINQISLIEAYVGDTLQAWKSVV